MSPARPVVRAWLSARHALVVEAALLVAIYMAYDAGRGLAAGGRAAAVRHGRSIASVEAHLHLSVERGLQHAVSGVTGLLGVFGFGYATFHLGVTAIVLLWLHRRHPEGYAKTRTAIVVATGLALIGFALYPTAPPRLDRIGLADTLSLGRATSESGFLRFLYNPYAAMPSVHMAFAVLVGASLVRYARSPWVRLVGYLYPCYVAVEVIATGNHFVFDIAAGALTAVVASVGAAALLAVEGGESRRPEIDLIGPGIGELIAVDTGSESRAA